MFEVSKRACSGGGKLRFVFDDAVFSFNLARAPTFEQIAQTLAGLEPRGSRPIAIEVILPQTSRRPDARGLDISSADMSLAS